MSTAASRSFGMPRFVARRFAVPAGMIARATSDPATRVGAALHHPVTAPHEDELRAFVERVPHTLGRLPALGDLVPEGVDTSVLEYPPELVEASAQDLVRMGDHGDARHRVTPSSAFAVVAGAPRREQPHGRTTGGSFDGSHCRTGRRRCGRGRGHGIRIRMGPPLERAGLATERCTRPRGSSNTSSPQVAGRWPSCGVGRARPKSPDSRSRWCSVCSWWSVCSPSRCDAGRRWPVWISVNRGVGGRPCVELQHGRVANLHPPGKHRGAAGDQCAGGWVRSAAHPLARCRALPARGGGRRESGDQRREGHRRSAAARHRAAGGLLGELVPERPLRRGHRVLRRVRLVSRAAAFIGDPLLARRRRSRGSRSWSPPHASCWACIGPATSFAGLCFGAAWFGASVDRVRRLAAALRRPGGSRCPRRRDGRERPGRTGCGRSAGRRHERHPPEHHADDDVGEVVHSEDHA